MRLHTGKKKQGRSLYSQLLMILRVNGTQMCAPTALATANLSKLTWWSIS
ncbi:hypothetical protein IQ277_07560 [Nostocales cyanobacterium LEGE 12452]|nr:hypothetical protein [Nostocales cyanobacterium LEGE 12452]